MKDHVDCLTDWLELVLLPKQYKDIYLRIDQPENMSQFVLSQFGRANYGTWKNSPNSVVQKEAIQPLVEMLQRVSQLAVKEG